ncbi:MAG: hypothetical protein AMJ66_08765 [Betaproteobacteria bacterium SG8_40]|nr:MAG: hypothetical protein AMJ66_08765 [Betaproteobacteria bacterium SG8_40]
MLTPPAIPDPRRYADNGASPLAAGAHELAASAADSLSSPNTLAREISGMLARGDEKPVRDALRNAPSAQACRVLYRALDLALTPGFPADADSDNAVPEHGVHLHLFAIPVLLVVGAPAARRISGVVPDTGAIRALFEQSGALGHCRNFGLSNVLAAPEQIDAIPWTTLHSVAHAQSWAGYAGLDLPPTDIDVEAGRETVHLRFMSGAALTPTDAPAFAEAAGDIGSWGMPLTKELGRQLTTADVSLLAIPRVPRSIVRALQEGWFAVRELGFQLFLSNALRQARMRIGEPDVTVTACPDQTIRIRLTSPFDELLDQTYGWPLSPGDDFEAVATSISTLLEEARVERVVVVPDVKDVSGVTQSSH